MAKSKFDREEDVVINDKETPDAPKAGESTEESPKETPKEEPVDKKDKAAKINDEVRKVKVRVYEDLTCTIGGERYTFRKDKEYSVPSDVAAILSNGKKAYRL